MIFNFPAQTEDILISDIERVVESGASQTTFYPLMASPSVARSLARTVGKVDYSRERLFYQIIDELLAGGSDPLFDHGSAWTFIGFRWLASQRNPPTLRKPSLTRCTNLRQGINLRRRASLWRNPPRRGA